MIEFVVPGIPAPQGSKTPWGSESNPATKPWRAMVAHYAHEAMEGRGFYLADPLVVSILFTFPRPKSHFRTGKHSGVLRDDAPLWKTSKPDLDKLVRAVLDGCTGIVWRDDSQVAFLTVSKVYGDEPCAAVAVVDITVQEHPSLPKQNSDD
jgi:Holliday junction resolvase RusA-like endonuclease